MMDQVTKPVEVMVIVMTKQNFNKTSMIFITLFSHSKTPNYDKYINSQNHSKDTTKILTKFSLNSSLTIETQPLYSYSSSKDLNIPKLTKIIIHILTNIDS